MAARPFDISTSMAFQLELTRRSFFGLVLLILAVLVALLLLVYLPSARVTLYPATTNRTVEQEITLTTSADAPDFLKFTLPANVAEKEIEDSTTINRASGEIKEDFAKGVVTLINEQAEEQPLLPKTHLRHEETGVQFLTDSAVRIPPQGEITIAVTAEEAGPSGNVSAGKFIVDRLPASTQQVIYARSNQAFTGGLSTDSAVTEAEIAAAKEELLNRLRERARGELTLEAGGAAILPELVHLETLDEASSAQVGSATVNFTVRAKVRARAFVVTQSDLLSLTLLALRSSTTSEEEFVSYEPESFSPRIIRSDFERGQARLTGSLTGTFAQKIPPSALSTGNIAGLGEQEAVEYFEGLPAVGRAEVKFYPFWVTSIPARPTATEIAVNTNQH